MSSGACRALVSLLLAIVASIVLALPVAAISDQLKESSDVKYQVHPDEGTIDVRMDVKLSPLTGTTWRPKRAWGPLAVEETAPPPDITGAFTLARSRDSLPGLWKPISVLNKKPISQGDSGSFTLRYALDADPGNNAAKRTTPARVNDSYIYLCVTGQDTNVGSVSVAVDDLSQWGFSQPLGTPMEITSSGYRTTASSRNRPGSVFTCFEGVRQDRLLPDTIIGPRDRAFELQAWSGGDGWLDAAGSVAPEVLRDLDSFIGQPIPGDSTVVVRMAPSRDVGGYASTHGASGIVQLSEFPLEATDHQLAHAWYGADNFPDIWLREGMAEWTASAMRGTTCEPASANPLELDLSEWMVVQPQSPDDYQTRIEAQDAAACGIVAAVRERMPQEQWDEVVGSMLRGETKYIGTAGPETGTSTGVDYREWLDAVDERGLVPAAADPAYAANLDDLDFAQNLLDRFGIAADLPGGESELMLRSQARAAYHQFLADIAPLGAPRAVRKDMDDWEFRSAMDRIDKSREVYQNLIEADRLLPVANLPDIVQPQFEAAANEAELDAVTEFVDNLLKGARGVAPDLGAMQSAAPAGWFMPLAVRDALSEQRWSDISAAIAPATRAVQEITAADVALPQANFLDKYKLRYENSATAASLQTLADEAASDHRKASIAGRALEALQVAAGEWAIPAAVTRPLETGEIDAGTRIIGDAQAVVDAATSADEALPQAGLRDEVRPQFEAVTSGAEMAALRKRVEARAAEAMTVGNALATLELLVPSWHIPAVVADPVAAGNFGAAVESAKEAERWIKSASDAQAELPDLNALESIKSDFESARTLRGPAGRGRDRRRSRPTLPARSTAPSCGRPSPVTCSPTSGWPAWTWTPSSTRPLPQPSQGMSRMRSISPPMPSPSSMVRLQTARCAWPASSSSGWRCWA